MLLAVLLLLPVAGARVKYAPPDLPRPESYVEDRAKVIDAERERTLNGILQELEQRTGVQYIILTVPSTGGLPIEQFSIELLDKWKLGQRGKDNGLLFTLASKDRRYRFDVGYGLEGFVTDNFVGQVGREVLVPYLKSDRYGEGIYQANLRVVQHIASRAGVELTGMPSLPGTPRGYDPQGRSPGRTPCFAVPGGTLLFVFFLIFVLGGRGGGLWWLFLPSLFRGFGGYGGFGRSGSYGGGPFGGSFGGFGGGMRGGFGRFGGGGGGGFGGGGASGSW